MIHISGSEHVSFPPEAVFDAGIRAETWPHIEGLLLRPQENVLALGGLMRMGLTLHSLHVGLETEVTEFVQDKSIVMDGRNSLAAAHVAFHLEGDKSGIGTEVFYKVELHPRSLATKLAERSIRQFVHASVPRFTAEYTANVTNMILGKKAA